MQTVMPLAVNRFAHAIRALQLHCAFTGSPAEAAALIADALAILSPDSPETAEQAAALAEGFAKIARELGA